MRNAIFMLLLPLAANAEAPSKPAASAMSPSDREEIYEEHGMNYAKKLYLGLDGSPEDEVRSKKSEILNYKIRERSLAKLEAHLAATVEPRIRQEITHRLSQLYDQQAEMVTRRSDLKNKEGLFNSALRKANGHLESLRINFPKFAPDATLFNLAENYGKLKEPVKAEKYYREVVARFPRSPVVADSLLALGNLYFERQAFLTARNFYERMLSTEETTLHPYAHYKMAWCYFNENDFSSAVGRLESAIQESRKLQANSEKKLGVEEEALSDLVLFFAEYGNLDQAKPFFERLVNRERANELRYQLARRLFEHGKHALAKDVAQQLLNDNPQHEFINKIYLILISVAERTKDRDFGLKTAEKLASWLKEEKPAVEANTDRVESEEYMRQYSQKLHHEAETLKTSEIWAQARKAYEIYLNAFPNETETPEVKFRYGVLLLNRKEQLKAYRAVTEALAKMDSKHARFKDALKVRIQSVELASKEERKQIEDRDLLSAYDAYAKNFSEEELGIEAQYKAATLAKTLETPEQAAARFRAVAYAHPKHNLAKASIGEALAVLVKAEKWEALGTESRALSEKTEIQTSLQDEDLKKKIAEAGELALVKVTEGLEAKGAFLEAKAQYEKILENPSDTMGLYAFVRLATLSEQKLNQNRDAIKYYTGLKEKFPNAKEAKQSSLELARLYEKVNEPREAVRHYLDYARAATGKVALQALTNAAVTLESLGDRDQAADVFFQLASAMRSAKSLEKEAAGAYEAGCNNVLLSSYQNREKSVLRRIHDCSKQLSQTSDQPLLWQTRAAWALDQMADGLQAEAGWRKIASRSLKATPETERAYVAMAKLRLLDASLREFRDLRFTKTNEKPEANIGKKTAALAELEKLSEGVIKIGTPKQIGGAKEILRLAYVEFAETMELAAVPSKLSEAEKGELKKTFLTFAQEFRAKAAGFENKEAERTLASVVNAEAALKFDDLSREEVTWLENGSVPQDRAPELFAKKAYALFRDGKYGEAKYFTEKWKRETSSANPNYGEANLEKFQGMLAEKLPETDPVSRDF